MKKSTLRKLYYVFMGIFCLGFCAVVGLGIPATVLYIYDLYKWKGVIIFGIVSFITLISSVVYHYIYDKLYP